MDGLGGITAAAPRCSGVSSRRTRLSISSNSCWRTPACPGFTGKLTVGAGGTIRHSLDELDSLTQEAVRLFFSNLDGASLPPMSRAILYGSRARGDHRDDSDVDIMLVFAGVVPDYDTQVTICNAMASAQAQANAALPPGVEVTSFCNCWLMSLMGLMSLMSLTSGSILISTDNVADRRD